MPLNRIGMNVILMMHKINAFANPMISEPALPEFPVATDDRSEFMRVSALDQLHSPLDGHVVRRSQEQVNVFGHNNESVQGVAPFPSVSIQRFQEEPYVDFDNKQLPAVESQESYEISSRRGEESSRFQERTSAAESRTSFQTLNWHEWNSCPSRLFFVQTFSFWERANG